MAAANDATVVTCTNNSDYAVICSFFEQFGDKSGLLFPSFHDLQQMLENVEEVSYPLIELHVKLMRKLKKSVNFDRWEKAAAKYAHSYSDQDGWEIERFGYKKLNLAVKLRLLKNLLEAQFDGNIKFKNEINKVTSDELRLQPLGKDIQGRRYWHQLDDDCNLRVYREDLDEETWDLVSSDKESMLKLIGQLSSDNGLQEDEGTSPATSEENSANGQEEDLKVESEDRVQQLTDGPSETKRLKVESVEDPAVSESQQESIVSEAIESPVLLVKGEGNGADCDTGNPGDGKSEESCESHNLNSEQGKLDDTSAIDCESNKSKSCAEPSETVTISQPNSEFPDPVPNRVWQSPTLNSVRDSSKDKSPEETENTSSASSYNVEKQPDSEDCPANQSDVNPVKGNILDSLTSSETNPKVADPKINDFDSKKEAYNVDEKLISLAPEDIKSNSIEQTPTEVEDIPSKQECTKPSEDEAKKVPEHVVDQSVEVDVSKPFEPAVPKTTADNSILTENQELPKPDCSAVDVKLIPVQDESAVESVGFPHDTVSSDQHPSTSYIINEEAVRLPVCLPSIPTELQEAKKVVEPVSIPADSTLIEENSSKVEESHSEQTKELKDKCLDDVSYEVREKTNTAEVEAERSNLTPYESPAKIEVKEKEVMPEADDSNSLNQRIEPKIDSAPEMSNVNDLLKDNDTERLDTLHSPSATLSAHSPSSVLMTLEATKTVSDLTEECDLPSRLQENKQSSEDSPACEDIKKHVDKEKINESISTAEREVKEESPILNLTSNYVQSSQINETIRASSEVNSSTVEPDVVKDSEACADPANKSVSEELAGCTVTDSKALLENTNNTSISNLSEYQNKIPENLEINKQFTPDLDALNPSQEKISTNVEEKLPLVQDEVASNRIEEIPEKKELMETKDSISPVDQLDSDALVIAKPECSIPELSMKNVKSTSQDLIATSPEKEDSPSISTAPVKEKSYVKEDLPSTCQEPELKAIPVVSQNTLEAIQSEEVSELDKKEEILAIPPKEELLPRQPEPETISVLQKIEVNEIKLGDIFLAKEKISAAPTEVISVQQELENDVVFASPQNKTTLTEPENFTKDQPEVNVDIPTPLVEDKSISPQSRDEVQPDSFTEIIQNSESVLEHPKESFVVVAEQIQTEVIPAGTVKEELLSVQKEPKLSSILAVPHESELKQTEPKEISTEKLIDKEVIPTIAEEELMPKVRDKILPENISGVIPKKEHSSEKPEDNTEGSILVEKEKEIPSFTPEEECHPPEVLSNAKLKESDQTTIQPKIPGLGAKEELLPVMHEQIEQITIQEKLNSKLPIAMPQENVQDRTSVEESIASPKPLIMDVKEDILETKLAIHVKEDQEMKSVSEVQSNVCEQVSKVPTSLEIQQSIEAKPLPNGPDTEKSSNLNQLSFDFDASAPVAIILPPSKNQDTSAKRRGRKRGRFGGGNDDSGKENDAQPTVLRQSSRIAKLREKEDEDRRKEEADRLQRLKEEHERREKRRTERDERMKKMEEKQQRRQLKSTKREDVTYKESEDESSSSDEEKNSEEEGRKKKGKKDKRRKGKKKIDRPWDSTDSSEKSSESDLDALEDLQVEQENEELEFKSDHEFSPESDLDEEVETVQPTKHARTAKAGTVRKKRGRSKKVKVEEAEVVEEEEEVAVTEEEEEEEEETANCHKCGQSDHPEWILLCDRCDAGWHANCVKPPLLVIPEGNWFCPPCDHATLLERLQERLEAYEFLLQEKEAELERRKEQELEAKLAKEEAEKQALLEMEEEAQEDDDEDEKNSGVGDLGADVEDAEDEETSDDSEEDEEEEEDEESQNESDENLNGRRQRKAAKQANYSFKDFDDMIKSALRDEGDEEEEEGGKGKGKGKGLRSGVDDNSDEDEDKPRSPPGVRPSGIGNKRISTSDDDSDIMPQVTRKKKARKLNDLSATSNEDDSDEDFQGSSAEGSDSEDDEEDASDSGDSFVVDDDSDDDDVIHVRAKKKARAASPIIRRSARSARKRNLRMDSSDTSEEESEYEEKPTKRKRGNESWDSSGESSSDASWGRSKKRSAAKSKAKPVVAAPKPKPKPPPRKAPANRGRGRGGRANKVESDDEPFRSNVSVKKIKEARPVKAQEDEDSDHAQRRTTRGRQISYKELISSGESQDEGGSTVKKMGTLFAADRNKSMAGAVIRGGASRRGGIGRGGVITSGRGNISGGDNTPVPVSVISSRVGAAVLKQDDESRLSGSTDTMEFNAAAASAAAAASVYTTGDDSHTSNDILTPSIDPDLATLPIILPQEDVASPLIKDELPATASISVLSQDLQVSRLIQQMPTDVPPPTLPPDLQINRLINSQTISSSSNSPARQSPGILPQPRLVRDVLDSQTPPPAVHLPPVVVPTQPQIIAPSVELPLYSHGGVIKQTRHSLPPTPPMYSSPHVVKTSDLIASSTPPSVIRPYPTTATSSSLSPSISGSSALSGNPLSIQGLLGTGHGSPGSVPSVPPSSHPSGHIRPYGNTPHMIGHGPFLNHTPYANPYSSAPPSRTSYMGTPVTPTPRQAYPPMYSSSHLPPHSLPLHSPYQHHGPPLRPTSSYQHAGFPQAFAAAAAAAASAEEERRIYRVAAQASRESGADNFDPAASVGLLTKSGADDPVPATAVPPESEFGGLVSYFSSQQEDFEES